MRISSIRARVIRLKVWSVFRFFAKHTEIADALATGVFVLGVDVGLRSHQPIGRNRMHHHR
jgi:hypothetical protein